MADIRTDRIKRDLRDFERTEALGLYVTNADNLSLIKVSVCGLIDTPIETGVFQVEFRLPPTFPLKPPRIYLKTPVWHPNVATDGRVCMDILDRHWQSGTALKEYAEAVRSLLLDPYPDSPLNADAAMLLEDDEEMYWENVKIWTRVFADGMTDSKLDEKLSILVALGMQEKTAVKRATEHNWDLKATQDALGL